MKAAEQFGWSKAELIASISVNAHEEIHLSDINVAIKQDETEVATQELNADDLYKGATDNEVKNRKQRLIKKRNMRCKYQYWGKYLRRWRIMYSVFIYTWKIIPKYSLFYHCEIILVVL